MQPSHPLYSFMQSKKTRSLYIATLIEAILYAVLSAVISVGITVGLLYDDEVIYTFIVCGMFHLMLCAYYAFLKAKFLSGKTECLPVLYSARLIRYLFLFLTTVVILSIVLSYDDIDEIIALFVISIIISVFLIIYNFAERKLIRILTKFPLPPKKSYYELTSYMFPLSIFFAVVFGSVTIFCFIGFIDLLIYDPHDSLIYLLLVFGTVSLSLPVKYILLAGWCRAFEHTQFIALKQVSFSGNKPYSFSENK